jgi:hypothetical protein
MDTACSQRWLQQALLEPLHVLHSAVHAAAAAAAAAVVLMYTPTGSMLLNAYRSKIAGTIKRDGLSITKLPAQGRPATAVLELLRAKEARNIRISSGGLGKTTRGRNSSKVFTVHCKLHQGFAEGLRLPANFALMHVGAASTANQAVRPAGLFLDVVCVG